MYVCTHTNTHTHTPSILHHRNYTYLHIHYLNYFTIYQNERQLEKQIKMDENKQNNCLKYYKIILKNLEKKAVSLKYQN